jgi:hypothetical protein
VDVSNKELHILQHSLGLQYSKEEYRNHFCTGEGSVDYPHCESLVLKGLMSKHKDPFNEVHVQYIYQVTEEGRQIARKTAKQPTTSPAGH